MSATEDMGTDDVRNDDVRNDNIGTDDVRNDDVRNDNIGTDGAESDDMTTARAVRAMLLLMPRLVGRAKRLPVPAALRGLDLASRHLALLAHLQYDGPLTVSQLADRLEVAPTTVSLMVGDLSRRGLLTRQEDDADRRRKIVAIAPDFAAPVTQWLSGSAAAWTEVLAALTPAERATVVGTMRAYEAALEKQTGALPRLRPASSHAR